MKKILVLIASLSIVLLSAQDKDNGWKMTGVSGLNMNQSYYSDNWKGTETGSVSWKTYVDMTADKEFNSVFTNKNKMNLEFGQTHSQDEETGDWKRPEKTSDKISIESIGLFTLNSFADPFVSLKFESVFIDESVPGETKALNPITLTESFGAYRSIFNNENHVLDTRLGFAFKEMLNSHDAIDNTTSGGIEMITDYTTSMMEKRADFKSSLNLYKAVYYSEEDDVNDDWKEVDINWQNTVTVKLNSFLNVNFYTQLLYDKEISTKGQFKQTSGLGVSYKFM